MSDASTLIKVGDTRRTISSLEPRSVQTIITSPPYFGLRDYQVEGQVGLEASPDEYVRGLVEIFHECREVLRDDGSFWLNIGDSYVRDARKGKLSADPSLKPKDLIGIPWMLAFALRADGWYLRSDIIWHKPNALPESVRDRPASTYEHIFLFSKSEQYFYDVEAVKVPGATSGTAKNLRNIWSVDQDEYEQFLHWKAAITDHGQTDMWRVSTKPFHGAHFATFPPDLIMPCIRAGTAEPGICPCGASWVRQTGRPCGQCNVIVPTQANSCPACGYKNDWKAARTLSDEYGAIDWNTSGRGVPRKLGASGKQSQVGTSKTLDLGWSASCSCSAEPVPAVVLDPFGGSGTTALVANQLGRNAVLLEINPQYAGLAHKRLIDSGVDPTRISLTE